MATTFYTVWSRILDSDDEGCVWIKGFRTVEAAKAAVDENRKDALMDDDAVPETELVWRGEGDTWTCHDEEVGLSVQISPVEIDD